jgi:hypothetical protein
MLHRLLILGVVALSAIMVVSAVAQPITAVEAGRAIAAAGALSGQIRSFHRGAGAWMGYPPPPPGYCRVMSEGELVLKDLSRLASKAIYDREYGLALRLQRAGEQLGDELDEEEEINNEAGMTYDVYPCPAATSSYAARAIVLRAVERRMPACRARMDAQRVSFAARRSGMQQCLSLPGRPLT